MLFGNNKDRDPADIDPVRESMPLQGEKRRMFFWALAGGYLVYLGYQIISGYIHRESGSNWFILLAAIVFCVVGAFVFLRAAQAFFMVTKYENQQREAEAPEEEEEEEEEDEPQPQAKRSISDRAHLADHLKEDDEEDDW